MNGPQKENGFTAIANEIMEIIAKTDFNGTQRRIIDVVLRQTYGWQRKEHELSLTFIAKATDIHKMQIQRELAKLIEMDVILITKEGSYTKSRTLAFNKDYNSWSNGKQLANKITVNELASDTVSELDNSTVSGLANQIKKVKENKESTNYKLVYDYYLTLDLVKHRAYTNDISKAIKKGMADNKYSVEYAKVLLDRHKKVVDITKNKDYPVRARGLPEFFGQKAYKATHLICSEYEEGGKLYEEHLKNKEDIKKRPPLKKVYREL